jgi:hypothetical protein
VFRCRAHIRRAISIGERAGVRNGARVEYIRNGETVGYGSIFDVGTADR